MQPHDLPGAASERVHARHLEHRKDTDDAGEGYELSFRLFLVILLLHCSYLLLSRYFLAHSRREPLSAQLRARHKEMWQG